MLAVGDRAPDFVRHDHKGRTLDTAKLREEGPLVVYFYPRDFTPGCTKEACLFRDAFDELSGSRATIIGVSVDDDASHAKFAERYRLPFSLVADPDRDLAKRFGIMRAFGLLGARRVTFVIDRDGRVKSALHAELSMDAHLTGVRESLASL
ncbi:MAG: peroxiredoxin [Deltaproteobacteria bacterium]|nr:peroxiredoxin [Deltaproteobacteria bacterium]